MTREQIDQWKNILDPILLAGAIAIGGILYATSNSTPREQPTPQPHNLSIDESNPTPAPQLYIPALEKLPYIHSDNNPRYVSNQFKA